MTYLRTITMLLAVVCLSTNFAFALDPADGDLYCRVVDVGAGQCCIIKIPGKVEGDDHYRCKRIAKAGNRARTICHRY